jgi:hypothetical protein
MKLKRGRCFNIFLVFSNEALHILQTFVVYVVEIINNNLKLVVHTDKTKMKLKRGRCFNIFLVFNNEALHLLRTFVVCVVETINLHCERYVLLHMCC